MKKNNPRVLLYDIENTPIVVTTWGLWEQNAIEKLENWYMLSYSYKWSDEKKVHVVALPDFKGYKNDKTNDKQLCESLHKLFDEADIVVAHNGNSHDQKKSNSRFIFHGLTPPSPYKQIDTKLVAKRYFHFDSNSLDNLGTYLKLGNKVENSGIKLWRACMNGDMRAWKLMKKYNCVTPDHKLLGTDLRWKEIKDFNVGDKILGFDENGKGRKYKTSTIESLKYDIAPVYKVTFESGKEFKVTGDHKWLVINWVHDRVGSYKWKTTLELNKNRKDGVPILLNTWEEDDTKDSGWLAGMYDGEGCLYHRGENFGCGNSITISQKEGEELNKIIKLTNKYSNNNASLHKGLYGTGKLKIRTVRVSGSAGRRLEFLGKIRPERLISSVNFDKLGRVESRNGIDLVKSIELIGNKEIAIIGTSSRTFICDGYPMHNCQDVILLEKVYLKLLPWIENHPNLNRDKTICPNCNSNHTQNRGKWKYVNGDFKRLQCQNCGHWFKGEKIFDK